MNDYQKGLRKANSLVDKAKKYRDTRGYRENLGFDQQTKLEVYLSDLNLTYQERCAIKEHFFAECRKI